jgi:ectoine hydroxylase-related dioxygenase (phytanoyl-CoA dioxygenase family)
MTNLYNQFNGSYSNFMTNIQNLNQKLEIDGVAVIPNILDQTQINSTISNMHNWLRDVWISDSDRINIQNPQTYRNFYKLFPLHSGMLQHHGIGHQQFVWDIRQNRNVIKTFETIWSDPDLLVSFDGVNFVFPPEITNRGYYQGGQWFHTDQSSFKKGLHCIQGMVNLYDVTKGDGTLSILTGSHKLHEDFFSEHNIEEKSDWYKISDQHLEWFIDRGCEWKNVLAPAGSMIFWDSRTFHMAIEPQKRRPNQNFRFVVYVCMKPRSGADLKDINKKINTFIERRMTSHWPYPVKMFGKQPRTYGADLPNLNEQIVSKNKLVLKKRGLKLIGLDFYDLIPNDLIPNLLSQNDLIPNDLIPNLLSQNDLNKYLDV